MPGELLRDWKDGDPISAAHLNEAIVLLRKLASVSGATVSPPLPPARPAPRFRMYLGKIVTVGPTGQSDLTDARYWVKPEYVIPSGVLFDAITLHDLYPTQYDFGDDTATPDPNANIVAVTNVPELAVNSHTLTAGQYVVYFYVLDGQESIVPRYLMCMAQPAAGGGDSMVKLTGTYTGGGKYKGRVVDTAAMFPISDTVAEGTSPIVGSTDVMVINTLEFGSSGHAIDTGGTDQIFFMAQYIGTTAIGSTPTDVYVAQMFQTFCS